MRLCTGSDLWKEHKKHSNCSSSSSSRIPTQSRCSGRLSGHKPQHPGLHVAFKKISITLSQHMQTWVSGDVGTLEFHLFKLLVANGTKSFKNGEITFFCLCDSGRFITLADMRSMILASMVLSAVGVVISSLLVSLEFLPESLSQLLEILPCTTCFYFLHENV